MLLAPGRGMGFHRTIPIMRLYPLAFLSLAACAVPVKAPAPAAPATPEKAFLPPVACRPDGADLLASAPGRERVCVIDVGSRNVKLVVASLSEGDARSLREERVCRARLQLGEKTFDQTTRTPRPLAPAHQQALVTLLDQYVAQCSRDGGRMLGGVATEWARRATNPDEILRTVDAGNGVALEILSRERESRFGYLAATLGTPGKIVLDFGSRSVQLAFWPQGAAAPNAVSIPIGIDEAGDRFFGKKQYTGYGGARDAFITELRVALGPEIQKMREELAAGRLSHELFSLAENGDVALALEGKLRQGTPPKGVDEATYGALLKTRQPAAHQPHGLVTAMIPTADLVAFGKRIEADRALFEELRSDRIKRIYGYKMLAFPAVVELLTRELGLRTVVQVPQELPAGVIVDRLQK